MGDVASKEGVVTRADAALIGLLVALSAWTAAAGAAAGHVPSSHVALLAATAGTYVVARLVTRVSPLAVPAVVVAVAAAVAVASPDLADRLRGPLGYSNATAALFVQSTAAAAMLALRARPPLRQLAAVAAVAFAAVPVRNGSVTGAVLAVVVLGVALAAGRRPMALARPAFTLVLLAVAATIVAGAVGATPVEALMPRRATLWGEALDLTAAEPLLGVGPGRFRLESPTVRADADAAQAHNAFLQSAAELGVPGLVLLLGVVAAAFTRLRSGPTDPATAVATAALAAAALHSTIDYVWHFAAVPLVTAALVAAGNPARRR